MGHWSLNMSSDCGHPDYLVDSDLLLDSVMILYERAENEFWPQERLLN